MVNPLACSLGNDNDNLCGNIVSICHSKNATFWCVNNTYMVENLFAIVFCIMSLVIGILMIIYGLSVKRNISKLKKEGAVAVNLGEFVLISGIWVITDSRALTIFTTDCGGMLNRNAIAFLSYISIMLLPIIYIFPLFRRYYRSKSCGLWMGCLY